MAPPPAPTTFGLFAGPSIAGPDSVFYDLQVVDIPDTLRNTALSTVTFSSVSFFTTTTGAINGLAVWPSFEIRNRQSGALGLQQQYTGGWEGSAYGGYVLRDTLFGAFKKIRAKGCILSCMAMATSYFGDSVRVDQVNEYLVRHRGYGRDPVVRIASVTGQEPGATLTYTEIGDAAKLALRPRTAVNDTLLFEDENARAWRAPVVTAVVGPAHGQATIVRRHQHGVLSVGSHGYAYVGLITSVVTDSLAQGHWTLADLGRSPGVIPQSAEQALTDSLPVLLDVCGAPKHYVLARGWKPTVGASSAHGTYVINDPGHSISRLSDPKFNNTFARARRCQRTNPAGTYAPATLTNDLSLVVSGGGHAGIVAPNGDMLYYDPGSDSYGGTLVGADGWPGYMSTLDDDPDADSPASDYVTITGISDGDYRVLVTADQPGSYALDVRLNDVNGEVPHATGDCTITSSGAYAFNVHVETGATPVVRIDTVGTASVGELPLLRVEMVVRPNPTHGLLELAFILPGGGLAAVEVFDVAGRKIGRIFSGEVGGGWRTVKWDARSEGRLSTGLYFVRMSSDHGSIVRRVVLMD